MFDMLETCDCTVTFLSFFCLLFPIKNAIFTACYDVCADETPDVLDVDC